MVWGLMEAGAGEVVGSWWDSRGVVVEIVGRGLLALSKLTMVAGGNWEFSL